MRRRGLWLAAALVVLSNLAAWRAAGLNRTGEPDAVLTLTERELQLPVKEAENTALTLTLVFEPFRARGPAKTPKPGWFDRAKLESIGFDCSRPVAAEHASFYRTRPPRSTYAALEFEGEAWRRQVAEAERTKAENGTARDPRLESHLVAIDVDNDPAALRRRHPDRRRVAIVEAAAALVYAGPPGQQPYLSGRVTELKPGQINVPREWRGVLEGLQPQRRPAQWPPPQHEPRFRATIAWGRRLEPWITSVELLK